MSKKSKARIEGIFSARKGSDTSRTLMIWAAGGLLVMATIIVGAFSLSSGVKVFGTQKPDNQTVADLTRQEIIKKLECSTPLEVTHFELCEVGDYSDQFGGWPVRASYGLVCNEGNDTRRFGEECDNPRIYTAFVRRGLVGWETFTPAVFQAGMDQLKKLGREMEADILRQLK